MSPNAIIRHPPERDQSTRNNPVRLYAGACCCCCLHTVGSLAGAFLGGGVTRPPGDCGFDPERRIPGVHWLFDRLPRTQWVFWSSLFWVIIASLPMILLLIRPTQPVAVFEFAGVYFVLLGPAYLVAAWLLGVLRLARLPAGLVQPREFWALHKTLGWSLFGAGLGIALMAAVLSLF